MAETADIQPSVGFQGILTEADVAAVRRRLAEMRMTPERQVGYWLELWRRWPEAECGELCLAEAERLMALLRREREVRDALGSVGEEAREAVPAAGSLAERHFVWLGGESGVRAEHLRDGIARLSAAGLIDADREQQEALRRGLGLWVNDTERHSAAPWVRWLGPVDMLWLLVEGLWQMGLVTCAGGRQQKWRTALGVFLRPDGRRLGANLRNSRCTNAEKKAVMRDCLFGELQFISRRPCALMAAESEKT